MKLLCDEMLKGLARWLRMAGYDVEMEPDFTPDRKLIERALKDGRILLTRDRTLLEIRHAAQVVVLLNANELEDCVREVTEKLGINWLYLPFSRCSPCNSLLQEIPKPPDMPADIKHACICPTCGKYYWHGGHVKRMRHRLAHWQSIFGKNQPTILTS